MAKRQASNQITHDNWDKEDSDEEPGQFQPVSSSDLQNRVIRKAKRMLPNKSADEASRSPFSGFGGFGSNTLKPAFSIKSNSAPKEPEKQNGSFDESREKKRSHESSNVEIKPLKRPCLSEKPSTAEPEDLEHFRQLQKLNESVLRWMQIHMAKNPYCDFTPVFNDYKSHLNKLEELYPVKKEISLKKPLFFYSKAHSESTMFKSPESAPAKSTSMFADASANSIAESGFSKFMKTINEAKKEPTEKDPDSEMSYGAGFKSNTTNTSTFSFRSKPALTATSTGSPSGPTTSHSSNDKSEKGEDEEEEEKTEESSKEKTDLSKSEAPKFSFGLKSHSGSPSLFSKLSDSKPKTEQFSFASASAPSFKPFSFVTTPAHSTSTSETKEDEEYVPPKNEVNAVVEKDAVYSKRCKLFFKKDDAYADKGVGTLYLKPRDGKMQLLIRADTNLGNILLNIMLTSSLPMERTGKNNVLIVCVPNPPLDAKKADSKEAIPMLIRVKTSEDADELLEALNKHKS